MTQNNPTKIRIYTLVILYVYGEMGFSELYNIIIQKFNITKGGFQHYINQLCNEGLITCRNAFYFVEGYKKKCNITDKGVKELFEIRDLLSLLVNDEGDNQVDKH
ncbi:hypothetical protein [Sulfolobus acidocaldarius]|uniref:ArnR1-like winged helix-turn-helix domain-containing protein n=4 Tax=Sulfolobus acidocaldarius TaxID=2285 RepID=Q4JAR2_SULAC|nr:hypothetical protein [Sulfolobus acidocaldarius]AAY80117.1 hypothetical protein Saci_0739 [Sulfolobus acidocaldarius DSM 639]AGE70692.1 hypothetical protein SacN8_03595 [Sulfolobus acidocaldarius N8]AGE72964.1 hypothetical protein SacRon12I_03580 [Sulfolobus acidocaldarius Ron12/I]ALU28968.1 hypothetical protein ATY89_02710 [Sulfolobus acidocaldarius]ALU31695.1 hypothetical protein ATZ20_05735 [Sulfolobus acidocaldarius]